MTRFPRGTGRFGGARVVSLNALPGVGRCPPMYAVVMSRVALPVAIGLIGTRNVRCICRTRQRGARGVLARPVVFVKSIAASPVARILGGIVGTVARAPVCARITWALDTTT